MRLDHLDQHFLQELAAESGQDLSACYACGNCTAGCPAAPFTETPVHQTMRLAALGRRQDCLSAEAPWLCASCRACSARCPAGIDVAAVMEAIKRLAARHGVAAPEKASAIERFYRHFLDSVASHGRVFELGLAMKCNLLSGRPLNDADLGPAALAKGKLSFRPHKAEGRDEVARIMEKHRCKAKAGRGA